MKHSFGHWNLWSSLNLEHDTITVSNWLEVRASQLHVFSLDTTHFLWTQKRWYKVFLILLQQRYLWFQKSSHNVIQETGRSFMQVLDNRFGCLLYLLKKRVSSRVFQKISRNFQDLWIKSLEKYLFIQSVVQPVSQLRYLLLQSLI